MYVEDEDWNELFPPPKSRGRVQTKLIRVPYLASESPALAVRV